ncbi:hypothetical protein F4820DRAFT_150905 [Hypoxylon rubiginosum]|uniref:Uncharacterized protein n=1 Tax=Hypoxylon rubiginosum TaxID=110542 RepID=A0ACB9Z9W8_9PEZI|nr:hypothetical protein F4820DRAFT_150905 [Hypoxylon rubiginosum]
MALNEPHKARIIGHMNKDHAKELTQYLRAFNGMSSSAARGAQLTDMTLDAMTIESTSGTYTVAITPPLGSAADARVRLVDMSQRAQQLLGLSDIQISTFTPPQGGGIISSLGVSLYFISAATLALVQPGTAAWGILDVAFPYGAAGYKWLVKAIFLPVLIIHITEAWWIARTRLAKHGIEVGSTIWLLWVANTFVEGFPAMKRFDGLVEVEKKKKESAKH